MKTEKKHSTFLADKEIFVEKIFTKTNKKYIKLKYKKYK